MRRFKFKYLKAENFLCFGTEGIEIDFQQYGNIILVGGRNLDAVDPLDKPEERNKHNNGIGKSSIAEIPVYALYGKTIKKPKKVGHTDLINHLTGKRLYTEFRWDDYRVVRTRKPDSLRLWQSADGIWCKETELTKGGMPATQQEIDRIVGLSYETFVNLVIFSDDDSMSFLECDGPTKREVVENLLALDKYRQYTQAAKDLSKGAKDRIKILSRELEHLCGESNTSKARLAQMRQQESDWRAARQKECDSIHLALDGKRTELENCGDIGAQLAAYQDAKAKIVELQNTLPTLETTCEKLQAFEAEADPKLKKLQAETMQLTVTTEQMAVAVKSLETQLHHAQQSLDQGQKKIGTPCGECGRTLTEAEMAHVIESAQREVERVGRELPLARSAYEENKTKLDAQRTNNAKIQGALTDVRVRLDKVRKQIRSTHEQMAALSKIKEPEAGFQERLLQEQLEELLKRAIEKQAELDGESPFVEIIKRAEKELLDKEVEVASKGQELRDAENKVPYYDFWVKSFGDQGIRKYVIDGIVPALNSRIAHWLQFLVNNKIKLEFNNELDESIDRYPFDGRPYIYHLLSGAQQRHLNLSVSGAFAYLRELNAGCSPSVIWLDEVSSNIDEAGVEGVYRMICELAKEKQVMVIDHNESLLRMLDGCDTIALEMKNAVTKMVG